MRNRGVILFFICVVLLAASCAKKKAPATISDAVVGKWQLTRFGSDDNLNGKIDNYEMFPVDTGVIFEMEFKDDRTGIQTNISKGIQSIDLPFHWEFLTYDSLKISYAANDTITYYVSNTTSLALTLTTTSKIENSNKTDMQWLYFSRK